ncbi:MFS transporter [Nostocoides jenkinsii]|uniref:Major facilitator superfamily (MFS) profile domain-containing protein n=1 Tax=Nostocoides jenkinsii Ben 74 TaxID=1193518 RepID=A0A077MGJ4_9MICO|nr:MFS transporter [Tetrasphaera jenkinsii]CCI54537.1 membrane hypothetical protein [Tetrasphaera jenkinsii Ben 74]
MTKVHSDPREHELANVEVHSLPPAQWLPVAGAFAVQGLLFIGMTTHLPALQHRFDLGELGLTLILLAMVLLSGAGSVLAEQIATRRDSATALRIGLSGLSIGVAGIGLAPSLVALGGGVTAYGLAVGMVDAASNMQGIALEHRAGRTLLPDCTPGGRPAESSPRCWRCSPGTGPWRGPWRRWPSSQCCC